MVKCMPRGLQDEIKQSKPFDSLHEELWLSLLRTAAAMSHELEARLRGYGLSLTQYNVLRILRGAPDGLCQYEIRNRLVAQVPDVPRILDRMEKTGLILRVRGEADKRMMFATLTEAGHALVGQLDMPMNDWVSGLFGQLEQPEMRAMVDLLAKARGSERADPEAETEERSRHPDAEC